VLRTELHRRSVSRVVRTAVTIKSWIAQIPSVDDVRPHHCAGCGVASRPVGGRVAVHGHGLLHRQLRGVLELQGEPGVFAISVRRYACQECGAVMTVVPAGVLPLLGVLDRIGVASLARSRALGSSGPLPHLRLAAARLERPRLGAAVSVDSSGDALVRAAAQTGRARDDARCGATRADHLALAGTGGLEHSADRAADLRRGHSHAVMVIAAGPEVWRRPPQRSEAKQPDFSHCR
jgi:hypothetical protein